MTRREPNRFPRHSSACARRRGRRLAAGLVLAALALTATVRPILAQEREKPVRNPGVAFLLSIALPGAGQLYLGETRGYAYLGVEAVAWFARTSYLDAGNKKEGEYEAYARRHWSYDRYRDGAGSDLCGWTAANDSLILHFMENDPQQYYEEVGKYDRFRCGWDDFMASYDPANPAAESPNRTFYRDMRRRSNDLLDNARLAGAALVLNRVVSGIDAFRTARARKRGAEEGQTLRLESGLSGSWQSPRAELRLVKVLR